MPNISIPGITTPSRYELTRTEMEEAFRQSVTKLSEGNALSSMLYDVLDKSFYEHIKISEWNLPRCSVSTNMQWIKFDQLPTGDEDNRYRPKERMQGLLDTLRGLSNKIAFLLVRSVEEVSGKKVGYTSLYMGIYSENNQMDSGNQLRSVAELNLTGSIISPMRRDNGSSTKVEQSLEQLPCVGLLTGQPSIRHDENENPLQTLDKLTMGFRDIAGQEKAYAVLILAEPVKDTQIRDVINRVHRLKSDLQEYRKYNSSLATAQTEGHNSNIGFGLGAGVGGVLLLGLTAALTSTGVGALAVPALTGLANATAVAEIVGLQAHGFHSRGRSQQMTRTDTISVEHVNYPVDYCMKLLDKMVERLEGGRNRGFWNVGTYILGKSSADVNLVASTLRSIYDGEESYQEPLRILDLSRDGDKEHTINATAHEYVKAMSLMPLPFVPELKEMANQKFSYGDGWHIFGELYESLTTPLNTEELSIMMSLPHRDVAGLGVNKEAVEFSTNPPPADNTRAINLGKILDMGAPTGHQFYLDIDRLNSHGLIVGLNGSGKTVTSRNLLYGMIKHDVPFLVVDPIKTDYLYWADAYNCEHKNDPNFKPIALYAPGIDELPDLETSIETLQMNPFQPYAAVGAKLNIMNHTTQLLGILRRIMAMGDFLPMLLDEAVHNYIAVTMGREAAESTGLDPKDVKEYPIFSGLKEHAQDLLKERNYSQKNTQDFMAAIETRINNLTRGWKKDFFETQHSTPAEEIFNRNVVISLAGVGDNNDKSFLMAMLVQALYEYRASRYTFDTEYRARVKAGRKSYKGNYLAHYTVLEEAHRIICAPRPGISPDADPQGAIAEKFCEILSEIREPGEGILIIDQYPSRLIADAIKNTNVKLIHRLQANDDRQALAGCIGLDEKQSRLLATLKKGHAIIGQDNSAMWLQINYNRER